MGRLGFPSLSVASERELGQAVTTRPPTQKALYPPRPRPRLLKKPFGKGRGRRRVQPITGLLSGDVKARSPIRCLGWVCKAGGEPGMGDQSPTPGSCGSRRGRACARPACWRGLRLALRRGVAAARVAAVAAREGAGLQTGECHASVGDAGAGSGRASSRPLRPLPRPQSAASYRTVPPPGPYPPRAAPCLPRAYTPGPLFSPVIGPALWRVEQTGSMRPRACNREVVGRGGGGAVLEGGPA